MKDFYDFAGNHPILTFFLATIVVGGIVEGLYAIGGMFHPIPIISLW